MAIGRAYWVRDMGTVADSVDTFEGTHYYTWSGTIPSWFNVEPFYPGATEHYPSFTFTPPEGTYGSWLFGVSKYTNAGVLAENGFFTIDVLPFDSPVWNVPSGCYTANLVWLDPSGGWESYLFVGKQQTFQDKGKSSTYINADGEKRFHRKDEVHQGTIITTGNISPDHADYLADLFKSIQVYLWSNANGFTPILVNPETFKRVKSGDAYTSYDFEFRFAEEDVIQTQ